MQATVKPVPTERALHELAECKRDNTSMDFHSRSYSYRFRCPVCGASRRYNTNFLGNKRIVVCAGEGMRAVLKTKNAQIVTDEDGL